MFHLQINGKEFGPFDAAKLKSMVAEGRVPLDAKIRKPEGKWSPVTSVKGLNFPPAESELPPVLAKPIQDRKGQKKPTTNGNRKLILVCLALWFFFGLLGVHAFYAGRTAQGITYIVMSVLGGLLLAAPEPLGIVGLVMFLALGIFWIGDLIRLITQKYADGQGNLIVDWH